MHFGEGISREDNRLELSAQKQTLVSPTPTCAGRCERKHRPGKKRITQEKVLEAWISIWGAADRGEDIIFISLKIVISRCVKDLHVKIKPNRRKLRANMYLIFGL